MSQPLFWKRGTTLRTIENIKPQLASWDKNTHPSQVRLQAFRQPVVEELLPILPENEKLFLHLDVDVGRQDRLLKHHDLENYLTPLFGIKHLNPARFALVTARKYVGGGSKLMVGTARAELEDATHGWDHFAYTAHGSVQSKQWKENLRAALAATNPLPLAAPAVEVQIAWKCSPRRNWVMLWKPTGDCMGPILGEVNPMRPFAPNDDRIVQLKFHRGIDSSLGNNVLIHMSWRAVQ